jgi:hypothetical protein
MGSAINNMCALLFSWVFSGNCGLTYSEAAAYKYALRHAVSDNRNMPKAKPSMAEQLAKGGDLRGVSETDLEERVRPALARPQHATAIALAKQPQGDKTPPAPHADPSDDTDGIMRSMVAQAISTMRGPGVICFVLKNKRRKYISFSVLPEFELNEHDTVLVLQFMGSCNVEVRGRNLAVLALAVAYGRAEYVRIADGDFDNVTEPYITDLVFHPFEPGKLEWNEKGDYTPAKDAE